MPQYAEWSEPHGDQGGDNYLPVICRAKVEDVIKWGRRRRPQAMSDEEVLEDFLLVYWAQLKEYPD